MNIVSEGLFGEKFQVLQTKEAFVYGKLLSDNYKGWIKKSDLSIGEKATHRVSKLRTFVYETSEDSLALQDLKLMYGPLGTLYTKILK